MTPEEVIKKIASVADDVACQAGVGGVELAGQFVSVLTQNPELIGSFLDGTMDMIGDDRLFHAQNGCLTWHARNGQVISPEQYLELTEGRND